MSGSATPKEPLLGQLIGTWEGSCRTWTEPGKPADEARVEGEYVPILDGRLVRHSYRSTFAGKPRQGEELIAYNGITSKFQISWIDDFHMGSAILFSEGERTEDGFFVHGEYAFDPSQPRWGWRTQFHFRDADHVDVRVYNIDPQGTRYDAIEIRYARVKR